MKVVQRKIKKSGKDRKRIGRGGSAYILDKRRITAVQNMKREAEKEKLRERFAAAANMPKDVVLGASVVTVIGNGEISIENYRGILEYTGELIRVQTKKGQIQVHGKGLQIEYYLNDEMKITGNMKCEVNRNAENPAFFERICKNQNKGILPGAFFKSVQSSSDRYLGTSAL